MSLYLHIALEILLAPSITYFILVIFFLHVSFHLYSDVHVCFCVWYMWFVPSIEKKELVVWTIIDVLDFS